ncbi:hypothetical protein D0T85_12505 [Bacteroides sp. 519]|nr:hypothetical protein [Bacteroides sp. 519]
MFKVVNCTVVECITVQVGSDDVHNFIAEFAAGFVQFNKVELLTYGF